MLCLDVYQKFKIDLRCKLWYTIHPIPCTYWCSGNRFFENRRVCFFFHLKQIKMFENKNNILSYSIQGSHGKEFLSTDCNSSGEKKSREITRNQRKIDLRCTEKRSSMPWKIDLRCTDKVHGQHYFRGKVFYPEFAKNIRFYYFMIFNRNFFSFMKFSARKKIN